MAEKKVANSVVALSSAAVLAIYGAGYARTREAADRFAQQATDRRPHIPAPRDEPAGPSQPAPAAATIAAPIAPSSPDAPAKSPGPVASTPVVVAPAIGRISPVPTAPKADTLVSTNTADAPAANEGDTPSASASSMAATPSAPITPPPAAAPVEPPKSAYKDGTFYGWGTSRHGDIQAAVVIEDGRITVARVERCLTRYSCNWITPIPPRILSKQGTTYDYVSGATESSDAFQDAVSEALSQAK